MSSGGLASGGEGGQATLIYRLGMVGKPKKLGEKITNQPITWEFVIEYFCKEMGWKLSKPQLVIRSSEPSTINEVLEWLDVFELLVEGSKVFLFISSNIYMPNLLRKWNLFTHTNQQTGSYEHEAPCDPLITWTEVFHRTSEHFDEGLDPLVVDWSSRSCRLWLENWSYWKVCSICFLEFYICIYGRYTIYNYMCVCLTLYNRFFFKIDISHTYFIDHRWLFRSSVLSHFGKNRGQMDRGSACATFILRSQGEFSSFPGPLP